ncbi:type II toxin-antitoxin system RelE/ParE family toxin [Bradyrhizobium sp. B025]|jgi:putative addiction module killer protein
MGNANDVKAAGAGVSGLRVDCRPGYRVYYNQVGNRIVLILCGGDKSTQDRDIRHAKAIAAQL